MIYLFNKAILCAKLRDPEIIICKKKGGGMQHSNEKKENETIWECSQDTFNIATMGDGTLPVKIHLTVARADSGWASIDKEGNFKDWKEEKDGKWACTHTFAFPIQKDDKITHLAELTDGRIVCASNKNNFYIYSIEEESLATLTTNSADKFAIVPHEGKDHIVTFGNHVYIYIWNIHNQSKRTLRCRFIDPGENNLNSEPEIEEEPDNRNHLNSNTNIQPHNAITSDPELKQEENDHFVKGLLSLSADVISNIFHTKHPSQRENEKSEPVESESILDFQYSAVTNDSLILVAPIGKLVVLPIKDLFMQTEIDLNVIQTPEIHELLPLYNNKLVFRGTLDDNRSSIGIIDLNSTEHTASWTVLADNEKNHIQNKNHANYKFSYIDPDNHTEVKTSCERHTHLCKLSPRIFVDMQDIVRRVNNIPSQMQKLTVWNIEKDSTQSQEFVIEKTCGKRSKACALKNKKIFFHSDSSATVFRLTSFEALPEVDALPKTVKNLIYEYIKSPLISLFSRQGVKHKAMNDLQEDNTNEKKQKTTHNSLNKV